MHVTIGDSSTCLSVRMFLPPQAALVMLLLLTGSNLRSDAPEFRPTEIPRVARTGPSHRGGDTPREGAASKDASSAAWTPNGSDKAAQDATPR